MGTHNTLMPLWKQASGASRSFIFYDDFTTPDTAPVTTPRICEPGPGKIVYTGAKPLTYSISDDKLVFTVPSPSGVNVWYLRDTEGIYKEPAGHFFVWDGLEAAQADGYWYGGRWWDGAGSNTFGGWRLNGSTSIHTISSHTIGKDTGRSGAGPHTVGVIVVGRCTLLFYKESVRGWVLDDIRPLRALAKEGYSLLNSNIVAFEAPEAIMAATKNLPGYYFYGDAMFRGENRQPGAMISFFTSEDTGKVSVTITDNDGKVVKTLVSAAAKGFNRFTWRFDRNALPQAGLQDQDENPRARYFRSRGGIAIPGTYKVTLKKGEKAAETYVTIKSDPRLPAQDFEALRKNQARAETFGSGITALNSRLEKFRDMKQQVAKSDELIAKQPIFAEVISNAQKTVKESIEKVDQTLNTRPEGLLQRINGYRVLLTATGILSQQEEKSMQDAETALAEAEKLLNSFTEKEWSAYREVLEKISLTGDKIIIFQP